MVQCPLTFMITGRFDLEIANSPDLDSDVPWRFSYGVYISQLIQFAGPSSNFSDFSCRNKALTAKLLRQGYRYYKLRKALSKLYRRYSALVEKMWCQPEEISATRYIGTRILQ